MNEKKLFNQQEIDAVLQSKEVKLLLSKLQKDGGSRLAQALDAIKKGDQTEAKTILQPLLREPDSKILLQELNRKLGRS